MVLSGAGGKELLAKALGFVVHVILGLVLNV